MQKLADTRPIGIGSMGANSSGMHGRDPDAPHLVRFREMWGTRDLLPITWAGGKSKLFPWRIVSSFITNLSSRPERSGVERSAVFSPSSRSFTRRLKNTAQSIAHDQVF